MAEISKGKRASSRRSSILKTALADIDVNVREKTEPTKSKRVSFADTCCIKEFPRDSPQILKAAEHNDSANTSADGSLQDADIVPCTQGPSNPEVDQPLQDNVAAGSSFIADDGETTFISGMGNYGDFRESTRRFDRMDSYMIGDSGGLQLTEITPGENSVFISTPATGSHNVVTAMPSGTMCSGGKNAQDQCQPDDRPAVKKAALRGAPELSFHGQGNRTVLFDDLEGGTMDLTAMDTSGGDFTFHQSPKVSARDFLDKMRGRVRLEGPQEREEQCTILFSDTGGDGIAMEMTQNLTEHNVTGDFKLIPQASNPNATLRDAEAMFGDVFGTRNGNDMNTDDVPKVSAKSFLASLRQNLASISAGKTASESTTLTRPGVQGPSLNVGENEQRDDGDVTMELTCQNASKPISQTVSKTSTFQLQQSMIQTCQLGEVLDVDNEDVTEVMELTGCMDNTNKMSDVRVGSTSFSVETQLCLGSQQETKTSVPTRNALMDITARHSVSPPSVLQHVVEKENVCIFSTSIHGKSVPPSSNVLAGEQDFLETGQPPKTKKIVLSECALKSYKESSNKEALFADQENIDSNGKTAAVVNLQSHKEPLRPVQIDRTTLPAPAPVTSHINVSVCVSEGQHPLSSGDLVNQSVHFVVGEDMEITHDFVSDTQLTEKSIKSKTDKTAANMSLTYAEFSQVQPGSTDDIQTTDRPPTEKQHVSEKSVFAKEATAANISLTCADLPSTHSIEESEALEDQMITFKSDCGDATQKRYAISSKQHQSWEKSIVFAKEATAANMSLTCADLPSTLEDQMITFKSDCGDATQKRNAISSKQHQSWEKSIVFVKEATAANMSLTCADLPSTLEDQTVTFKSDCGDTTQKRNAISSKQHRSWEKSIVFAKEASAADMSLTCANLSAVKTAEQNETVYFEESQTVPSRLDSTNITQSRNRIPSKKCPASEKSIVFSKEATAANMSLTCADLAPLQSKENKLPELNVDSQVEKQGEDKTKTFSHDPSMAVMDMTCMSPTTRSEESMMHESLKQQESVVPSHDKTLTKLNHTLPSVKHSADAQKSGTCSQTMNVSQQSQHLVSGTEEEAQDGFFKREPTTLMDITRILDDLGKKMEQGESSEEVETERKVSRDEHTRQESSLSEQQKPENVSTVASRKLQLSFTTANTRRAGSNDSYTETRRNGALAGSPPKRSLPSSNGENEPVSKTMRLSGQKASDFQNICSPAASKDGDIFREPEPRILEEVGKADSLSTSRQRQSSSSSSHSGSSIDIAQETMPVFGLSVSNTSWVSSSALSVSAMHNTTGSFLSSGRSFLDKQEKGEEKSFFFQTCERLGVTQTDLRGWVCRRSSVAIRPEILCDTVEDQLNSASVVAQECKCKMEFAGAMETLQQREEASSEELEKTVMGQIDQLGLVAEAEKHPSVRQQIRGLLFAGRKRAQVLWKTHKADQLNTLAQKMEKHVTAVSTDLEVMMTSIEQMAVLKDNVDNGICRLQSQLKSLQQQIASKKKGSRCDVKRRELQQQQSDLMSLQEQVSKGKDLVKQMTQKEQDLVAERENVKQRHQMNLELQKQLAYAHEMLSALHSVHCWRPLHVEEHRVDIVLLYDAVLLSIKLAGSSPTHQITDLTVKSRLAGGSEPWAVLATELVVDRLSTSSQRLVSIYPSRQHIPSLLDEVTGLVEDIKALCVEIKTAGLRHPITIASSQVTASLWSTEHLRKVSLTTEIPVLDYPKSPLSWNTQVIMGDIGGDQLQTAISKVGAGRKHFTNVLQAVHALLRQ